jgi:hypothetical protein
LDITDKGINLFGKNNFLNDSKKLIKTSSDEVEADDEEEKEANEPNINTPLGQALFALVLLGVIAALFGLEEDEDD